MKVLHILPNGGSGIESLVLSLAPFFRERDVETNLMYLSSVPAPQPPTPPGSIASITVLPLKSKPFHSLESFRSIVREMQPALIHSHSFLPTVLAATVRPRVQHVRTVHAPYPYFSANDVRSHLKRRLEAIALSRSRAAIVTVSNFVLAAMPREMRSNAVTIYNGVPIRPMPIEPKQGSSVNLLAVGRLESQKGYVRLLAAFAEVRQEIPNARLTIAGDGSQRPMIDGLINKYGLSESISMLGHVSDVSTLYSQSRLYVVSSDYEGLCLSAIEALCAGCPVASTPIPPVREIVGRARCHIEFAADMSPSSLASAIRRALDCDARDPTSRLQTATLAREAFSADACAAAYVDLYWRVTRSLVDCR